MSQTVWNRRWRQKQALKAQLFDELIQSRRAHLDYIRYDMNVETEAKYALAYFAAHPWRALAGSVNAHIYRADINGHSVFHVACIKGLPLAEDGRCCIAAGLREITSLPVSVVSEQTNYENTIREAADITRRMREAGIWTGPR